MQTVLYQELQPGDILLIDEGAVSLTLEEKSGRRARLKIEANKDVQIATITTVVVEGKQ